MVFLSKTAEVKKVEKPYISMNKLAEFMTARPLRRKQIVKALRIDADYNKVRYSEVRNILPLYYKKEYDNTILTTCIDKIKAKTAISEWEISDNKNSILALKAILATDLPDLSNYTISNNLFKLNSMQISGVKVTLKPELYLQNKKTGKYGAIKIHFAKTLPNRLQHDNREYASVLLKYAMLEEGIESKEIENKACFSHDIFLQEYSHSPATHISKIKEIQASCHEIASLWNTL
ncbi:MAG: hypothetical protein M0D57_08875 [Sphingobacteriales bacterium JAD_PAG50586_3]|nr:MAG: hypothetical protein M0D57_08875 [Sphingobacteriales bacterium JAD_PAG50586_3]